MPELYEGKQVFNNPTCIDDPESGYYSTTILTSKYYSNNVAIAKVEGSGGSQFVSKINQGDRCSAGTVFAYSIYDGLDSYTGFIKTSENLYNIYYKSEHDVIFSNITSYTTILSNLSTSGGSSGIVEGQKVLADTFAVRPLYEINTNKIAYIRENLETVPATSSSFKALPSFTATSDDDSKLVALSDDTKIINQLNSTNLSTDLSAKNHAAVKYSSSVVQIPYNAKTLNLDSSAFTTENADYICALSDDGSIKKFAILGKTGSALTLDLESIMPTSVMGSSVTISFYSMKANGVNYSDVISQTPVTVNVEVVGGPLQTITYDVAGGAGSVSSQTVLAGKSFAIADGSSLHYDNSNFSSWTLTYTLYGHDAELTKTLKSNEIFTVPDTTNGVIKAKANYSRLTVSKTTKTDPTVYTITWDTNSPDNAVAIFEGTGNFNTAKTQRYDKSKVKNVSIAVPSAPKITPSNSYTFDGWFTQAVGGTRVETAVNVVGDAKYYAHWVNECNVTFDANGGAFTDSETQTVTTRIGYSLADSGKWIAESPTRDGYVLAGWYTTNDGSGDRFKDTTVVSGAIDIYAYWLPEVFMASSSFDPAKLIAGTNTQTTLITTLEEVKTAAASLKSGTNPNPEVYNSTSDAYHLFAKLTGKSGDSGNDWNEFRIIQTGAHDDDGSGLTFQMTHAWSGVSSSDNMVKGGLYSDTTWRDGDLATAWSNSYLKSVLAMNTSLFLPSSFLPSSSLVNRVLKNNVKAGELPNGGDVKTTYDRLAPLSFTEFVSNASTKTKYLSDDGTEVVLWDDDEHSGSTYQFWASKDLRVEENMDPTSEQAVLLKAMCSDREGNLLKDDSLDYAFGWLRSVSPENRTRNLTFRSDGFIYRSDGPTPKSYGCVVPTFALG